MKFLRFSLILVSIVLVFNACAPDADTTLPRATHLYFSDYTGKRIGVVDLNNLKSADILMDATDGLDSVSGMAIDFEGGKIYATEELKDRVIRFNLDGSGTIQTLYEFEGDSVLEPTAITFDIYSQQIYWANSGTGQVKSGTMDGSAPVEIMFDSAKVLTYCYGMIYDPLTQGLFYSDFGTAASVRYIPIKAEGNTSQQLFFPGFALRSPASIDLFTTRYRIFWADEATGTLSMGNLQNYTSQVLYDREDGIERPDGIAIDFGAQHIYWTDTSKKVIMRAKLDGTGEQEVVLENVESYNIVLKFDNQ